MLNKNEAIALHDLNSVKIIDSFAVKKLFLNEKNNNELIEEKICFLTLSDKYLIEKDETNSTIFNFYEFIHFFDGFIDKE